MEGSYLHEAWRAPDNTRLVSKQFSFRLPVHVAAKLSAIGDMYPTKNRTQIVADLLTLALDNFESGLPQVKGAPFEGNFEDDESYFYVEGMKKWFWELSNKYFQELEAELGNPEAKPLFGLNVIDTEENFAK